MIYYIIAILVFVLYFSYDVNSVTIKNSIMNRFFITGTIIFAIENIVIIRPFIGEVDLGLTEVLLVVASLLCFGLLIYTLFFALPFEETYIEISGKRRVYRKGMYGLSRHIGVLWFILMYLCLGLLFKDEVFTIFAVLVSFLNLLYVVFQDIYTFPRLFYDYDDYKKEVPFLIPNLKGIKNFIL